MQTLIAYRHVSALYQSLVTGIAAVAMIASAASPSMAYNRKDAGFVTSSKNRAVLDYIVCLEGAVAETPKKMALETSLDQAESKCRAKAKKLPKLASEPGASDIRSMIMECGFRPGEASPDADCGSAYDSTAAPVEAPQPLATQAGAYALSEVEQNAIMTGVQSQLKDPASAIFGGAVARRDADGFVYVCGSVNAKNSFGGYTGHQPYYGMLAGNAPSVFFAVVGIGGEQSKSDAILKVCHEKGILG